MRIDPVFYVYILTNQNHSVLYTGVTNSLSRRIYEHKSKLIKGFSSRYNVDQLVYYEKYERPQDAIHREKQIKAGSRRKKVTLITSRNPEWKDLYELFREL